MPRIFEYEGHIIRIIFFGDSTSPYYHFQIVEKGILFYKVIFERNYHRDNIHHYKDTASDLIKEYKKEVERWS